jgi:hypothetical protein
MKGHAHISKMLLDAGSEIDAQDKVGILYSVTYPESLTIVHVHYSEKWYSDTFNNSH